MIGLDVYGTEGAHMGTASTLRVARGAAGDSPTTA